MPAHQVVVQKIAPGVVFHFGVHVNLQFIHFEVLAGNWIPREAAPAFFLDFQGLLNIAIHHLKRDPGLIRIVQSCVELRGDFSVVGISLPIFLLQLAPRVVEHARLVFQIKIAQFLAFQIFHANSLSRGVPNIGYFHQLRVPIPGPDHHALFQHYWVFSRDLHIAVELGAQRLDKKSTVSIHEPHLKL